MGVIAKTVHEGGGNVEGIIPKFFLGYHKLANLLDFEYVNSIAAY